MVKCRAPKKPPLSRGLLRVRLCPLLVAHAPRGGPKNDDANNRTGYAERDSSRQRTTGGGVKLARVGGESILHYAPIMGI